MKKVIVLLAMAFIGTAGWRIGNGLSSDAISMAVGIFFGILAGIPAALLVLASDRRRGGPSAQEYQSRQPRQWQDPGLGYGGAQGHQPPVIILNGAGGAPAGHSQGHGQYWADPYTAHNGVAMADWPQQRAARPTRQFRVVGEQEEWLE
ncbi:MAG: hypothetical protein R2867_19875 [Caldilineaceae bacterium]